MRSCGEFDLTRALVELMVNIPASVNSTSIISVETLLLGSRVPESFRLLPHERRQGGRNHLHGQYNEYTRNATRFSASHGVIIDHHNSEAAH